MSLRNIQIADLISSGLGTVAEKVAGELQVGDADRSASIAWSLVQSEAEARLKEALSTDPLELIALAWSKAQALKKYADPAKYPSNQSIVVHLGEHTVSCHVHPEIDILFNEAPIRTLRFTLELAAKFKSAALTIRGGAIRAIAPGSLSAQVALKYGEVTLKQQETKEVRFPGHLDLGEGFPIGGPQRPHV